MYASLLMILPALTHPAAAAEPGEGVLIVCDDTSTYGSYCSSHYWETVRGIYQNEGVTVDETGSIPADVSEYHLVILMFPGSSYSSDEVDTLTTFLEGRGRLVLVAENDTYFSSEISRLNELAAALELDAAFELDSIDAGCGHGSAQVHDHAITDGVEDYAYGYTTWIDGGTPLISHDYLDGRLSSIVAVDQPDWATDSPGQEVVLFGDSNGLMDNCDPTPNSQLIWNLYDYDATDADGDGFVDEASGGSDCDDADSEVHPDAEEQCNGVADDCGSLPSDETDDDGDGVMECEGDCDDDDSGAYPGNDETPYNGIDDDCEGGDLTDVDGDGYDAQEVGGEDCDDEDDSTHPGAVEVEDDGIDQDCDGEDAVTEEDDSTDSGVSDDSDDDEEGKDSGSGTSAGCGCATGRAPGSSLLMLAFLMGGLVRRRK